MGTLAQLLEQPTAKEPEQTKETVVSGDGTYTQAGVLARQPRTPKEILVEFGHDPKAVEVTGDVSVSHRELVDGRVVSTYKYKLRPRYELPDIGDLIEAAEAADRVIPAAPKASSGEWFVVHAPDLQIGKVAERGGTEEIVAKFHESMSTALSEYFELVERGVHFDGVLLAFAGDCIEGWYSQNGKNTWLTSETLTQQVRVFRRLLMWAVEEWAPHAPAVKVAVVNGNHDDAQRSMNTMPGDGLATESAIAVSDALKLNHLAFGHVEVIVPSEWRAHMTFQIGETVVTMTHGDLFRPGKGMDWWSEQTFGRRGPGRADLLLTGHYHNFRVETDSGRTWIQGTTIDCGSDYYEDAHGSVSDRGIVIFTVNAGKVKHLGVV